MAGAGGAAGESGEAGGGSSCLGGGSGLLFCTSLSSASRSLLSRFLPLLSETPSAIRLSRESCDLAAMGAGSLFAARADSDLVLLLGAAALGAGAPSASLAKGSSPPEAFLVLAEGMAFAAPFP